MGTHEQEDLVTTLGNAVQQYVGILMSLRKDADGKNVLVNNATASFVDTGDSKLLVTNSHVIQEFRKRRVQDHSLCLAIGGGGQNGFFVI